MRSLARTAHIFTVAFVFSCVCVFALFALALPGQAMAKASIQPSIKNGKTYTLANSKVSRFLNTYTIGASAPYHGGGEQSRPAVITLKWKARGGARGPYKISISTSKKLKNALVLSTKNNTVRVGNLLTGKKYYWQVRGSAKGRTVKSKTYRFKTRRTPRTLKISGVSNVRDIGGYNAAGGMRIREGMLYRSARLDSITLAGRIQALGLLGIKTDLDLRRPGEGTAGTTSPLGPDTRYFNVSGVAYGDAWETRAGRAIIAAEMRVLANPANYPVLFHCTYGRDRTGTLAFITEALLGVSKTNLYKDYELSFFSKKGCHGKRTVAQHLERITKLYNHLRTYGSKGTLAQRTKRFLLDCGVTKAEISSIRKLLLVRR